MDLFLFYIPLKGKERPAKTKLMPAKLCFVFACTGIKAFGGLVIFRAIAGNINSYSKHIYYILGWVDFGY